MDVLHCPGHTPGHVVFHHAGAKLAIVGDVLFQGTDDGGFYVLNALTGERLFTYTAARPIQSSPLTYEVNGTQFVAVVATNTVLAFALGPDMPRE